jgi:hypothetical protein
MFYLILEERGDLLLLILLWCSASWDALRRPEHVIIPGSAHFIPG